MFDILIFGITFLVAYFGVELFRAWTLSREVIDIPNERSSHTQPTPRGGGMVIVVIALAAYALIALLLDGRFYLSYFIGAAAVAGISWIDDVRSVSTTFRFLVHSAAAAAIVYDAGFIHQIPTLTADGTIELGLLGAILTFLWIVWMINAYNFMDGIDGIAGIQAVIASATWLLIENLTANPSIYYFSGALLASSLGFLLHNWQPAKIFLGDVGSAFLGFTFAVLPVLALTGDPRSDAFLPFAGIAAVWFFVFDTVVTLLRRAVRGERVWQAHRQHLYQRLIISGLSHRLVAALYGILSAIVSATLILDAANSGNYIGLTLSVITILSAGLVLVTHFRNKLT